LTRCFILMPRQRICHLDRHCACYFFGSHYWFLLFTGMIAPRIDLSGWGRTNPCAQDPIGNKGISSKLPSIK
jgi:hypothetical protein